MIVDKIASVKLDFIKELKNVCIYKTDDNYVFILNGNGEPIELFYKPNKEDLPYRTTEGEFMFRADKIYDFMFDDISTLGIPMDMQLDVYSEMTPLTASMIVSLDENEKLLGEIDDTDLDNLMKDFDYE